MNAFRDVANTDASGLIALIGGCWSEYPGVELHIDEEEPWLRHPADYYSHVGGRMWVLPAHPPVEGLHACVGLKPIHSGDGSGVELKSLYVAAPQRRRGLGAALVDLVEREARERGARWVQLWSDTRFLDAHRLYQRLGYRQRGRRALADRSHTEEFGFTKHLDRTQ